MKRIAPAFALSALVGTAAAADAPVLPVIQAPAVAEVYIIPPRDGATFEQSFTERLGLEDFAPAGVVNDGTGQKLLLVDRQQLSAARQPIPR